jgi:hypothetical protein
MAGGWLLTRVKDMFRCLGLPISGAPTVTRRSPIARLGKVGNPAGGPADRCRAGADVRAGADRRRARAPPCPGSCRPQRCTASCRDRLARLVMGTIRDRQPAATRRRRHSLRDWRLRGTAGVGRSGGTGHGHRRGVDHGLLRRPAPSPGGRRSRVVRDGPDGALGHRPCTCGRPDQRVAAIGEYLADGSWRDDSPGRLSQWSNTPTARSWRWWATGRCR